MATDDPLREEDLPPQLRKQTPEAPRSERTYQTQPMVGDLVYRPGESTGEGARDAMARDSDPPGKIEPLGLAKSQPTDADSGDGASQQEHDGSPANEPHGAAVTPPVDDAFAHAKAQSAASPEESAAEPVGAASDVSLSVIPPASRAAEKSSDDGDSSLDAADDGSSADEAPADSSADSDETAAMDSPDAPPSTESVATTAEAPSTTTTDSSTTAAGDAPAHAAAANAENAPTASPGLAQGQVTSAARSQQREEDLPPRTTELLTPGPDDQPPMARPIVLVRLTDDVTHRMINDALAKLASDSSELMESIAADHVDYIFWQIRAQERAILRFD